MTFKQINKYIKQKVYFENKLANIKYDWWRNYWLNFFSLKVILMKLLVFVLVTGFSSLLFFVLREQALEHWTCLFNYGSGLNSLSNNQSLVYSLKILFGVLFLIVFIFVNKWYFCVSFYLISWNSFLNVIDKGLVDVYHNGEVYYNTVVDYIPFEAWHFYNNIADILIFVGLGGIILSFIYYLIVMFKNNDDDSQTKVITVDNPDNIWGPIKND